MYTHCIVKHSAPPIRRHLTLMLAALKTPRGWKAAEVSENGMTCETPYIFEAGHAGFWREAPEFVGPNPTGNKMGDKTDSSTNE